MNPEQENSTAVEPSKISQKTLILIVSAVLIIIIAIASFIIFFSPKNNSNNQNNELTLPANTCPSELKEIGGKMKAIYQGREVNMSKETYDWVLANCNQQNAQNTITPTSVNNARPVLTNLGVKFGTYNSQTKKAGDFVFDKSAIRLNSGDSNKIFFEYGALLNTSQGSKVFPEIIYNQLDLNTEIAAIAEGKVIRIEYQDNGISQDYSLEILFNNSNWVTIYDHILDVRVKEGDQITAGDILGKVAKNRDGKTGFTEIQVKYANPDGSSTSYCPLDLLTDTAKSKYSAEIAQLMKDWESFYGDTNLYNESAQIVPGCLKSSFTE
jgi:hypothetical protein